MSRYFRQISMIVLAAVLAVFFASHAQAQESLFDVAGIEVDVTADNALSARQQAFTQAQQKAFSVLKQRMLQDEQGQNAEMPDPAVISSLIKDFEVTQEKLSDVRYIGTYNIRFDARAVRQHFSATGESYTDVSSKPILVLPFYQKGPDMVLWSADNEWMQAWQQSDHLKGLVPVVVPLGDLEDVRDIGDNQALSYKTTGLVNMVERYGAGEAVLAIAVHNQSPQNGQVSVHIYSTEHGQPEYVEQITVDARTGETREEFLQRTVKNVYKTLQKDWKAKTLVRSGQQNQIQARAPISSLQEWSQIQQTLQGVNVIERVEVKSLSPKGAHITLYFHGDERRLRLALRQADMTLSAPRVDVTRVGGGFGQAPLLYELRTSKPVRRVGDDASGSYTNRF